MHGDDASCDPRGDSSARGRGREAEARRAARSASGRGRGRQPDICCVPSREVAPPEDEAELAHRLAASDVNALTAIAEWLWEPLAAYAYRIVGDHDAARDVAQEACVRLWEGRSRTRPSLLRPYLFRITRNLALDHVKVDRTRKRLLRQHALDCAPRPPAPDEVLERERVTEPVQRAIQDLPERRREVFVLAYLRGLSYVEIGEVMGISPKTVQNHMTAALSELRTSLRPLIEERKQSRAGPESGSHNAR